VNFRKSLLLENPLRKSSSAEKKSPSKSRLYSSFFPWKQNSFRMKQSLKLPRHSKSQDYGTNFDQSMHQLIPRGICSNCLQFKTLKAKINKNSLITNEARKRAEQLLGANLRPESLNVSEVIEIYRKSNSIITDHFFQLRQYLIGLKHGS